MNKLVATIGIDPGAKGAICLFVPKNRYVAFINTTDKPRDIFFQLDKWQKEYEIAIIMIEKVHAIPGTAAGSNFKFGYNTGAVNALAEVTGVGVDHVPPKTWQKFIGVTKKGKAIKQDVAGICEKLYPTVNIRGARGGLLDGLSDSLMIAHYAFLKYVGR